ncbi:hypothetical protein [Mycobacterium sp. 1274756.6]|uniref:hypothetical protein n=1 Tax=Mycobacterium sp. 1274756.6 TaxID=1834076 RepID=UPI0008000FAF|nr:hypothetical protein [Mycobacterium sp. 1274756.6]OBJ69859.1 hypothetical protein A5643_11515 [Mycobacterium sp. 1274756.6]
MSARSRAWLAAAMLCLLAAAAIAVTVPATVHSWREHHRGPDPLAPGLAALSDDELAALLPGAEDLPPDWVLTGSGRDVPAYASDDPPFFGYSRRGSSPGPGSIGGFTPPGCDRIITMVHTGGSRVAKSTARDLTDPAKTHDGSDIRFFLEREYRPAGFEDMVALVTRCRHTEWATARFDWRYTVEILEDSDPADGPRRFRYAVTTDTGEDPPTTEYYSYARAANLILAGSGSAGHQQTFDALFDQTLDRIQARR